MAKADLITQAAALGIPTEGLTVPELEEAIANVATAETVEEVVEDNPTVKRQKAAKAAQAAAREKLAKEEAALEKENKAKEKASTTAKEAVKDNRPVFTDERKLKFRFKKSAPKTLNIDGVSRKIADIIEDEEVMLELVNGNSNFLEQIY